MEMSSSQMTMGQLIAAVVAALPKFSEAQAYRAIKAENLRSQKRIDEFANGDGTEENKGATHMTKEAIAEKYGEVEAAEGEKIPAADAGGSKKARTKSSSKKAASGKATAKSEKKPRAPRGEVKVVEAGPRGFRFGRKWNESVQAGEGIACHPAHINKLKAHAEAVGYKGSLDVDAAKLCAAIAGNKKFDLDTGVVQATE
jgi:hypothetical protein